jgi:hypothetical protein
MYQLWKLPAYLGKGLYVLGEGEIARVYVVHNESAVPADAVAGVIYEHRVRTYRRWRKLRRHRSPRCSGG